MIDNPLHVAFLWHMHQPYYKDPITGIYRLPWVRLHAVKDYLDMLEILRGFPSIKQTFNLVPSLIEQIKDYEDPDVKDTFLQLSIKPAYSLTDMEKVFLLENFFLANWETMIKPLPRYYELLRKRGLRSWGGEIKDTLKYFNEKDFLDLQVLFNLSWIDPLFRETEKDLRDITKKKEGYTEEEKLIVLNKQSELIKRIIPTYRELMEAGRIELSTSPFWHPILPLLFDTDEARVSMPDIRLPRRRFQHPEDARMQIEKALNYFEKTFGKMPEGMWPSEGGVSEATLKAMKDTGIKWVASDEEVLGKSIGKALRDRTGQIAEPALLYKPYRFSDVYIFFRDHGLSDLIGFVYSGWSPQDAAKDLIKHFLSVYQSLSKGNYIVPIILDGENAWEYYKNDGRDFLLYLYEGLQKEERLKTITFSEYLKEYPDAEPLQRLHSGSWIYANFRTWLGHEEDNLAWDYLKEARDTLTEFAKQNPDKDLSNAWRSIYVAEGSDWNWWYGDEHLSETQKEFDELYRANLIKVYREIGKEPPSHLYIPILIVDRAVAPKRVIKGFISPKFDGVVTSYFEWYESACLEVGKTGGSMHKTESLLSDIYYGFDLHNLFLRIDPRLPFSGFPEGSSIFIYFLRPFEFKLEIQIKGNYKAELFKKLQTQWHKVSDITQLAIADIVEIGIPFADINVKQGEELNLFITVSRHFGTVEIERSPWRGYISLISPTPEFPAIMWY